MFLPTSSCVWRFTAVGRTVVDENSCTSHRHVVGVIGGDSEVVDAGVGLVVVVGGNEDGAGAMQGVEAFSDVQVTGFDPGMAGLVVDQVAGRGDDQSGAA